MPSPDQAWSVPTDAVYVAVGDGSSNGAGSFYGLVLIPEASVPAVEEEIAAIKRGFGGRGDDRLHCRELFHRFARARSSWSHLQPGAVVAMCEQVLAVVAEHRAKIIVAYLPKERFPARIRVPDDRGGPSLVHRLDEKWLTLWGFFQAGSLLDPVALIPPGRSLAEPGPGKLPLDSMLFRRPGPGPKVRTIHLDRETTRVRWLSRSLPWCVAARMLTIETAKGPTHLPIAPDTDTQPMLVELADLVTYSLAREIAGTDPIPYRRSFASLDLKLVVVTEPPSSFPECTAAPK